MATITLALKIDTALNDFHTGSAGTSKEHYRFKQVDSGASGIDFKIVYDSAHITTANQFRAALDILMNQHGLG
jgi:hypothetical protein